MRVVVFGASGNLGTSVLRAFADEPAVESVLGVARRLPQGTFPKTEWAQADVATSVLEPLMRGADACVHLVWAIQPSRDLAATERTNVDGSRRVFEAVAGSGVGTLVYASSVGAYSPGPKDRAVDESWPTGGVRTSFYGRQKAAVEGILDDWERAHPGVRSVRVRPGLMFQRDAAAEIRRLFAGPLLPGRLVDRRFIPVVPRIERLRFQGVHSRDVADAVRLAVITASATGAYNVAADPVLDPERLGIMLEARPVAVPASLLRIAALASWKLRLQPTPPGWLDLALGVPIMDTRRIREELGWEPRKSAEDALLELLQGMREGAGAPTPPLEPGAGGPLRIKELLQGVGARN